MMDRFIAAGGDFIDTADVYPAASPRRLLGVG